MDIRTLRYFLVTAQERNFTKAANKLCMAQPPLSRQIKLLRRRTGCDTVYPQQPAAPVDRRGLFSQTTGRRDPPFNRKNRTSA